MTTLFTLSPLHCSPQWCSAAICWRACLRWRRRWPRRAWCVQPRQRPLKSGKTPAAAAATTGSPIWKRMAFTSLSTTPATTPCARPPGPAAKAGFVPYRPGGWLPHRGHVPAADVRALLQNPKALGLAVPGMPVGSPGMDGPAYGNRRDPTTCCWSRGTAAPACSRATTRPGQCVTRLRLHNRPHDCDLFPARDMGSITRVAGIEVGHYTDGCRPTAAASCWPVRGRGRCRCARCARNARDRSARPCNLVEQVHAVMLRAAAPGAWRRPPAPCAGSKNTAQGLDIGVAACRWCRPPVLFDLMVGDMRIRPDAVAGYAACAAASRTDTLEGKMSARAPAPVWADVWYGTRHEGRH